MLLFILVLVAVVAAIACFVYPVKEAKVAGVVPAISEMRPVNC